MNAPYAPLLLLVIKYNDLMTRYALRLTKGNERLAYHLVKQAMEEAYEEGKFCDGPELRSVLKSKINNLAKAQTSTHPIN